MRKKIINSSLIVVLALTCFSCKLVDGINTPVTNSSGKTVRYVANMISSSTYANPVITYTSGDGVISQVEGMNLNISLPLSVGLTATLAASCTGDYSPASLNASASINLKIYVNDSLKVVANDFQTDSLSIVTASANCSYKIK
ncbi:MAG: hypothetical protein ACYC5R_02985 [Melioribacteraceae bacterium]